VGALCVSLKNINNEVKKEGIAQGLLSTFSPLAKISYII